MLLIAALLGVAACGATPPQVPVSEGERVSSALTGITEACGESEQGRALSRGGSESPLEAQAHARALELAHVYVKNPQWIYQSETLQQVVAQAVRYLRECGLRTAANTLQLESRTRK